MGTIKRLNDQQKQQAQAEAAMPGAYENRYDEGIQNALAGCPEPPVWQCRSGGQCGRAGGKQP